MAGFGLIRLPNFDPRMWKGSPLATHGLTCLNGICMPVQQIVRMLANRGTVEVLLDEYPFLSREDIVASLDYGAGLVEELP